MGASQRHKCEIHGFTVIGDGSCPPYSQSPDTGPVPPVVGVEWTTPVVPTLQLGVAMAPFDMAQFVVAGSAPIVFSVPPADLLPAGLSLSSAGVLAGTPVVAGNAGQVLRATNPAGMVPSPAFTIRVV